jgi:uncharacterized protein (DUF4415 family)
MKGKTMSKDKFPQALEDEIKALLARPEDQIDTRDIPETKPEFWINAKRPNLYKPTKKPVTLRLDTDLVAWFKEHTNDRGYQTEINKVLRRYMTEAQKRAS